MSDSLEDEMEADSLSELLENLDLVEGGLQIEEKEFRQEEKACIKKHHECTHDRENCCEGRFFQYKCKCYDVTNEEGIQEERCACRNTFKNKAAEFLLRLGKNIKS
ncbi:u1-lycotoxin-Ls1k [Trichonephila clavipes]|nr:u1-lycotoxin-Ls1k [Trichonephila clavipes]